MIRTLLMLSAVVACLGLAGCAASSKSMQARETTIGELPGITAYYEQATDPHRRAVRKPVRDARARAMRMLAEKAGELLAETETWDSDARLVSIAEAERSAARDAVSDFRESLQSLQTAAARSNTSEVRQQYARAIASYRDVQGVIGAAD